MRAARIPDSTSTPEPQGWYDPEHDRRSTLLGVSSFGHTQEENIHIGDATCNKWWPLQNDGYYVTVFPWVRIENLASHILGRMAARLSEDWQLMYGHPIYFLETFVDPERFRGTCYRAANWVLLGNTTGRGKQSNSYVPNRSIKEILGYPLTKRFRDLLGSVA